MYEVKNKVVLITGGASGIGAEVVKNYADEGAKHVAILDLSQEAGTKLQNELNSKYGANKIKYYKVDVTDDNQVFSAYESVVKEHGYIDVVVNCAGIMNDSPDVYKKEIEVNVFIIVVRRASLLGNMYEVKNKVVLITGGASGIGAEVVKNYADEGAKHVAILDLSQEAGTKLQNELNSKYGANKIKYYKVDVTDDNQVFSAYESVVKEHGYIDVVVNCAGIMNDSPDVYKKEIEVNVTALVTSTLKAIELMRVDQGGKGGTVVNIASVAGLTQGPWMPIYWATKSAVIQFSNCIGHEYHYSKTGVRVLAICFGKTSTPLLTKLGSFDKHDSTNIYDSLNDFADQSPQSAARGLIEAYKKGASGSTWVIAANNPPVDTTQSVTKAYEVMSEHVL